jgi:hypothetical protein
MNEDVSNINQLNTFLSLAQWRLCYQRSTEYEGEESEAGLLCTFPDVDSLQLMRSDMGGAACCVSTVYAAAKLAIPVNIVCITPLTENLINGSATKPGDLVQAMNGLTIDVDNPDAEVSD